VVGKSPYDFDFNQLEPVANRVHGHARSVVRSGGLRRFYYGVGGVTSAQTRRDHTFDRGSVATYADLVRRGAGCAPRVGWRVGAGTERGPLGVR
jgi:hypothetical protein